jgi:hypothetical protein
MEAFVQVVGPVYDLAEAAVPVLVLWMAWDRVGPWLGRFIPRGGKA